MAARQGKAEATGRKPSGRPPQPPGGAERLDQAAAEVGIVLVDDGDGNVANNLAQVWLRIEHRVEHRGENEQAEDAAVAEHAAPLGEKGAAYAGPSFLLDDDPPNYSLTWLSAGATTTI